MEELTQLPWSSVPDNLEKAITEGTQLKLKPGEKVSTELKAVAYQSGRRVKNISREGIVSF